MKQNDTQLWLEIFFYQVTLQKFFTNFFFSYSKPYSAKLRLENKGEYAYVPIRFDIYQVMCDSQFVIEHKLKEKRFAPKDLKMVDSFGSYENCREATKNCRLPTGYYVLVPSTANLNTTEYLLRLFYDMLSVVSIDKLK